MKKLIVLSILFVSFNVFGWSGEAINLDHSYTRGDGVLVGVLDTAARCSHQELAGRCTNWLPAGYESGYYAHHGTHVASLIAGSGKAPSWLEFSGGVAPDAEVISYRLFDSPWSRWSGFWISDEVEAEAVRHGAKSGVSVFNQSYGDYDDYGRSYLNAAMLKVWRSHKNKLFVNAAGNDAMVLDPRQHKGLENVIFVGATDANDRITWWSNVPGEHYKGRFIVAPGDFLPAAFAENDSDYGFMSGTSMAAPLVTGAVALLHSRWPHLKDQPTDTADILFRSATDLGEKGVDRVYGHGLLNIAWYDSRGDRAISSCAVEEPPVAEPVPVIGTPGDGRWYDSHGHYEVGHRGQRTKVAVRSVKGSGKGSRSTSGRHSPGYSAGPEKVLASGPLARAMAGLSITFFDAYGRDFQTALAKARRQDTLRTGYLAVTPNLAMQLTEGKPNFKLAFGENGWVSGRGRNLGFNEKNPLLDLLDDGTFIANRNFGVMVTDTATTGVIRGEGITLTLTDEDGFLGSRGKGALSFGDYDTVSATMAREYGPFHGSLTLATSRRDGQGGGIVTLPRNIHWLAFAVGIKGQVINKRLNWHFSVSQPLQPIDGTLSVSYDDYYGRLVAHHVDLADSRDLKPCYG
ncbi:MAG: hypothetical protein CL396_09550 [Acidiferrobacteraceae bacterium]|jgi:hypothetical protein|nr:hypothetical protein [Acidiferrobacteraceae bacterium]